MKIWKHSILVTAFIVAQNPVHCQGVYIPQGMTVTANTGSIQLKGNWTNNGMFTHNDGVILFSGDTQTVNGTEPAVFNDVTIASGSTTTFLALNQSVKGILLSNGILNADGNITLLSTTIQTALIDGSGTGEVLGNVTMQRYLPSEFGYKYISSPFSSATVNQLSDDLDLGAAFSNFYWYDENRQSAGWVRDTALSSQLLPLHGYAGNFGTSSQAKTIDITGVVNNNDQSITLYNNNRAFTKGFNLVGNPFPSPVDWDLTAGWELTNIDNAVYYFNAGVTNRYKGTYSSYISGISSDGVANNMIPAMQGFFVHVTNGTYPVTGSITVNNNARVNNLSPFYHKQGIDETRPVIRLKAGFAENGKFSDPLVVYFDENATPGFDKKLDALKIMNTDAGVPNLYAFAKDQQLSIDALPYYADSMSIIPLGLKIEQQSWVSFDTVSIERLPYGLQPYFLDIKTGTIQDITIRPQYRVLLPAGTYENRFCLVFSMKDPSSDSFFGDVFYTYSKNGRLYVFLNLKSGGKGEVIVTSANGQTMLRQHVDGFGVHEFDANWGAGIYIVSFVSPDGTYSKKVLIAN